MAEQYRYTCVACGHVSIPFDVLESRDEAMELHGMWHRDNQHSAEEMRKSRIRNNKPLKGDLEASF